MTDAELEEDAPLDPVMERVRKKMVRLLVISIGIMVIGLMAVLGAIVYKIGNQDDEAPVASEPRAPGAVAESLVELAEGERTIRTFVAEDRLFVEIALAGGGRRIVVIDLDGGDISNRITVK